MMTNGIPAISVITPSFNQGVYIEQTIQSVLNQNCGQVEHIVMDGGSTDGTIDILKRYPHLIWRSERDRGQADALNKGLALARGAIIGWINSDDYYKEGIFGSVVRHFESSGASWVIGRQAQVFDDESPVVFLHSPKITFDTLVRDPDIVRQQAAFYKRGVLNTAGGWNPGCHMAMDYDLWVRLSRLSPPIMAGEDWAFFRIHAAQKTGQANILRQSAEITAILRREKVAARLIASHRAKKSWYWLKGVAKERLIRLGMVPKRYRGRSIRPV